MTRRASLALAVAAAVSAIGAAPAAQAARSFPAARTASNNINVACQQSRTSGYAPLFVVIDCSRTTSPGVAVNHFTDIEHGWNFGDDDSVTWSYGAHVGDGSLLAKKNRMLSPIGVHLFETPGVYTVTNTIFDGTNTATKTFTVTACDPYAVIAVTGCSTSPLAITCFFNSTVGTGCPAGATQAPPTSDADAAINGQLGANKIFLFKSGDTFSTSTPVVLNANGPWIIGSYGSGAKPKFAYGSGSSHVIFQVGSSGSNVADGRIMDIQTDGGSVDVATNNAFGGSGTFDQLTLLRVDMAATLGGVILDVLNTNNLVHPWDQLAIVDSTVSIGVDNSGGNSMFIGSTRTGILGNRLNNNGVGEHNFRNMLGQSVVIASNNMENPNVAGGQKANLTMRNPPWYTGKTTIPPNVFSQYEVAIDNKMVGNANTNAPVNTSVDSGPTIEGYTRYILIARNWLTGMSGVAGGDMIGLNSSYSAVWLNIADATDAGNTGGRCFSVSGNGGTLANPSNSTVYGNTCFTNATLSGGSKRTSVDIFAGSSAIKIADNMLHTPNAATATTNNEVLIDACSCITNLGGAPTNSQAKTASPTWTTFPPVAITDFKPTCTGSTYPCAAGVAVPVWSDFFGRRFATRPTGAVAP